MRKRGLVLGCIWIWLCVWLSGCQSVTPAVVMETPGATLVADATIAAELPANLTVEQAAQVLAADAALVIDVREATEFADGHISGATLIPLGELPARVSEIPTDQTVILVCRSGNRSSKAYALLQEQGFTNIHNMTGGMNAWQQAGYAIEK